MELHEFKWERDQPSGAQRADIRILAKEDGSYRIESLMHPDQTYDCDSVDELVDSLTSFVQSPQT